MVYGLNDLDDNASGAASCRCLVIFPEVSVRASGVIEGRSACLLFLWEEGVNVRQGIRWRSLAGLIKPSDLANEIGESVVDINPLFS